VSRRGLPVPSLWTPQGTRRETRRETRQLVWGRPPSPVEAHVGTAALGRPAERSSAAAHDCGNSGFAAGFVSGAPWSTSDSYQGVALAIPQFLEINCPFRGRGSITLPALKGVLFFQLPVAPTHRALCGKTTMCAGLRKSTIYRAYGKTPDSRTDGKGTSSTRAATAA
jgi:hypothetical protein